MDLTEDWRAGVTSLISDCLKQSRRRSGAPSRWIGGASLEEEGVAGVTDSDWFWRGGQRELVVGAAVAENLPTVPTVVLETETEGRVRATISKYCRVLFLFLII